MAVPGGVWSRRELVRAGALGGLLVAVPGLLAACGDADDGGPERDDDQGGPVRLVASDVEREAADPAALAAGLATVQALAAGLYGELTSKPGNLALSPLSAAAALAMTATGAASATREEMLAVLAAPDTVTLDDGLNALTAYVESLAGPVPDSDAEVLLESANQLFGQRDTPWRPTFLDALARSFGAGVREVDFVAQTEQARLAINRWTAEQTHDKITDLVPEGAVGAATRLVLVNALYLKAPWAEPFQADATTDDPFHLAGGDAVAVPTMHGRANVSAGDGWRAAHLPYAGNALVLSVVLPDAGREQELDGVLSGGGLAGLLAWGQGDAELALPRWTYRVAPELTASLQALGMVSAFGDRADFSGMTAEEGLAVGSVLQQVFIAVDEEGTEAAAATAVGVGTTSAPVEPQPPLVVDRPFVYVLHDAEHGVPLFLGKVVDPRP